MDTRQVTLSADSLGYKPKSQSIYIAHKPTAITEKFSILKLLHYLKTVYNIILYIRVSFIVEWLTCFIQKVGVVTSLHLKLMFLNSRRQLHLSAVGCKSVSQ